MIQLKDPEFSQLIQAIQSTVQGFAEMQKLSQVQLNTALTKFVEEAPETRFSQLEINHFLKKSAALLSDSSTRIALGPCLIYGTRSSPLLRVLSALHALKNRCSVVFLCNASLQKTYAELFAKLIQHGLPEKCVSLVSTQDPESLETLIAHPSLKAIHFNGHFYEGAFLKNLNLPVFKKRLRVQLGGRNPMIFMHDAPMGNLQELLAAALNTSYLAEHSFNRWFVQEKNFASVVKTIEDALPSVSLYEMDAGYMQAVTAQNQSLLKEKNWKTGNVLYNPDSNNCSPWQQQETLGAVLTVTRFKNSSEAIKFANTTNYASAAAVFSGSVEKSQEVANQLIMPHRFAQQIPDMGGIDVISGLSETGFGQEKSDRDFFVY